MEKNLPDKFDQSAVDKTRLEKGIIVGNLAKEYFGQHSDVLYSIDKSKMIAETQRLLDTKASVITEASFLYKNNFCSVDILRMTKNGYEIIEVKSSNGSVDDGTKKVESKYLDELAYQTYILINCGLDIQKMFLMQLNRDYVRYGELNIQELFVLTDCTKAVYDLQNVIDKNINEIAAVAEQINEPSNFVGSRCVGPDDCGFKSWCFRNLPLNNVFDIGWSMWGNKKEELYNAGLVTFEDVISSNIKLTEKQMRQIITTTRNLDPQINKNEICAFLSKIKYPVYFLDFETYQQPIPQWDNVSPNAKIPFQYSLHIQDAPYGTLRHKEFLGEIGIDPRRSFAKQLCTDMPIGDCVMVYHMSFEKGLIKALAQLFPDLSEQLMSIHDHIIDLEKPFQSGAYYCSKMAGSSSIKRVLPALCHDDPELDYNALSIVHNGVDAMNAYASLQEKTPEEIGKIQTALLAYCKLDTLAMVKILEKLHTIAKDKQ